MKLPSASTFLTASALLILVPAIAINLIQRTTWWAGYDLQNCPGCSATIDWSSELKLNTVGKAQRRAFDNDGVVVLPNALSIQKVLALADETDNLPGTFMTSMWSRFIMKKYKKYEHHVDTRSELIRDWAVHGPLGKWAADLLDAEEVRLYNAEIICHTGDGVCETAWHRDTIAAPFPVAKTKSVTFNVYLDDIGADGPNGDALIYIKGSHKNLAAPPSPKKMEKNLFEPSLKVGDVLAHDPNIYHTPSGRGCWTRRSLQFRYFAGPDTKFMFGNHRMPNGIVPWSFVHTASMAPHGLKEGDNLAGPWYPRVYPSPLESEHIPLVGAKPWSMGALAEVLKESNNLMEAFGLGEDSLENCTLSNRGNGGDYAYFGFDGPVMGCEGWKTPEQQPGVKMLTHKDGQMYQQIIEKKAIVGS